MTLSPDETERLARARTDLRSGLPVVLARNGVGALVISAETIGEMRLSQLLTMPGHPELAITARRAETLKTRLYEGDIARLPLPANATREWLHAVADPADDLKVPMKGPLTALRDGDTHFHRLGIRLAKSARLLPAVVVLEIPFAESTARDLDLTLLDTDAAAVALSSASPMQPIISARLPLDVSEAGRLHIFRPEDGGEEHYAVEIGNPPRDQPVLARLHSACFTGDVLGSRKCDCGPQLRSALAQMGHDGAGVLLYLNQEGRGIGLANKMRAYSLQDQGFDTVEANHRLGFEDDERDFRLGADLLRKLGFNQVRLLTNNPRKISMMQQAGLDVTERVPLKIEPNRFNRDYLATKARKSGHLL